jgi:hypothetical protein
MHVHHNHQTSIKLRSASASCSPAVTLLYTDEYKLLPLTTTTTTTTTATTVTTTTPAGIKIWMHSYWAGPILSALFLLILTICLCIASCILQHRAQEKNNKLYRKVLIRRLERKKEFEKLSKKEERHETKQIQTEEAFLANTVKKINEVMQRPESDSLANFNEIVEKESKRNEQDILLKVTSLEPSKRWEVPWKNDEAQEVGAEKVGATGTTTTEEVKNVRLKEELSDDDDWLQLDNQTIGNRI